MKPNMYKHLPATIPDFALRPQFVRGLPWEKNEETGKAKVPAYTTKPFHFTTKIKDYEQMKVCLGLFERTYAQDTISVWRWDVHH